MVTTIPIKVGSKVVHVSSVDDCNNLIKQAEAAREIFANSQNVIVMPVTRDGYIDRQNFYTFMLQFDPTAPVDQSRGANLFSKLIRSVKQRGLGFQLDILCPYCTDPRTGSHHIEYCQGFPVEHSQYYRINLASLKNNARSMRSINGIGRMLYDDLMQLVDLI